jgi:hypothetical protein
MRTIMLIIMCIIFPIVSQVAIGFDIEANSNKLVALTADALPDLQPNSRTVILMAGLHIS